MASGKPHFGRIFPDFGLYLWLTGLPVNTDNNISLYRPLNQE